MPSFPTVIHSITIKFYIMKLSKLMIKLPTYDTLLEPSAMPIITKNYGWATQINDIILSFPLFFIDAINFCDPKEGCRIVHVLYFHPVGADI